MSSFFAKVWQSRRSPKYRCGGRIHSLTQQRTRLALEGLEDRCVPSTLFVNQSGDDVAQSGTLRYAVAHSSAGDTIRIKDSVTAPIVLTHGQLELTHDVTIVADARATVTSGGGRLFHVTGDSAGGTVVNLVNLNITNGSDSFGGAAIYNQGGSLTLSCCSVSDNHGLETLGVILSEHGWLTISASSVTNNSGYGVYIIGGGREVEISDTKIFNNDVGVFNSGSDQLTFSDCAFWNNAEADIQGSFTDSGGNSFGQPQQSFFVLSGTALDQAMTSGIRDQAIDTGNANSLTLYDSGGQVVSTLGGERLNYVGSGAAVSGVAYSSSNIANGTRFTCVLYLYTATFYDAFGNTLLLHAFA